MKKFKTISGYLRANPNNSDVDAERRIINHLLPQLGFAKKIAEDETPRDGIKRIQQLTTDPAQLKALKDCAKWLNRPQWIVTGGGSTEFYRGKQVHGVSYLVRGFRRDDHNSSVSVIVDEEEYGGHTVSPHALAEQIAGPNYCFHASENILHPVPDSAKNRLFTSDKELYAADPQLRVSTARRRAR